ncbi:glyoxalase [Pengzhenrongella sicca]|uniref:Glyoxalase n=1 Tax=Pengzhenrongella sicca TaxID=2819238 RepID=A0A8A4ZJ03_9MICO|nr:glyoxalase [Pengzhenrongella sicca]
MSGIKTVIVPVTDLSSATALYSRLLAAEPTTDSPYYVGFSVGDQEIGLDPNGHRQGMTGPVGYWHVDDIAGALASLLEAGAQALRPVSDVGGGKLIATVRDGDGNTIGLLQPAP